MINKNNVRDIKKKVCFPSFFSCTFPLFLALINFDRKCKGYNIGRKVEENEILFLLLFQINFIYFNSLI